VAVWVQQDTIVHVVWASQGTPDDVMVVPSSDLGDFLVTDGADALLLFPQVQQLSSPLQGMHHFDPKALFKVDFPLGVIRVGVAFDFDVPFDGNRCRVE